MNRYMAIFLATAICAGTAGAQVRIKDIAFVGGARRNQLMGYGLVMGLDGSGDGNSTIFTAQSVVNMLEKLGVKVPQGTVKVKNVAAVIVTADLPAFVKNGNSIDVTVSSLGDAKSLQGGTLLQTPLQGADGEVYAVAQGPVSVGGFNFQAGGSSVQKNHVAAGRIPRGATVEREVPTSITDGKSITITLNEPDFTTASRIADAVRSSQPETQATALDPYSVRVGVPPAAAANLVGFIARVEGVVVTPDTPARIIVNERTGTVVIGGDVRVQPCAIAHGSIQVKVENAPIVAVPAPFTDGKPLFVPQKDVKVKEHPGKLGVVPATTTVEQLVKALNALGVTPQDLINILQLMRRGGFIAAELEVQ